MTFTNTIICIYESQASGTTEQPVAVTRTAAANQSDQGPDQGQSQQAIDPWPLPLHSPAGHLAPDHPPQPKSGAGPAGQPPASLSQSARPAPPMHEFVHHTSSDS